MRTLSAKPAKGHERPRRSIDDVRLLVTILKMAWDYVLEGGKVRSRFYARQRAGEKFYVDEP